MSKFFCFGLFAFFLFGERAFCLSKAEINKTQEALEDLESEKAQICLSDALKKMTGHLKSYDPSCLSAHQKDLLLVTAVSQGYVEAVRESIAHGANPNVQDEFDKTPLHYAADLSETMKAVAVEIAKILLDNDADPNVQNKHGFEPLRTAVLYENTELVELLLNHDANPNAQNTLGEGPLHIAAKYNVEITLLLLNHGADPNMLGYKGRAPIHYAAIARNEETMRLLRQRGAVVKTDGEGRTLVELCEKFNKYSSFCHKIPSILALNK